MSATLTDQANAVRPTDTEPFYGWRFIRRELPDGTIEWDRVPLTYEDVLHPEEGDQVIHSRIHQRRWHYLREVFERQVADDPSAVVLDDVRIEWDVPDLRPHGPDLMVIFGVRERKNWSTFRVAEEGVRPALIVEITSPETRGHDVMTKVDHYELAGVPLYVIVDAVERRGQPGVRLIGYTLTPEGYRVLAPDDQGRFGWRWRVHCRRRSRRGARRKPAQPWRSRRGVRRKPVQPLNNVRAWLLKRECGNSKKRSGGRSRIDSPDLIARAISP